MGHDTPAHQIIGQHHQPPGLGRNTASPNIPTHHLMPQEPPGVSIIEQHLFNTDLM